MLRGHCRIEKLGSECSIGTPKQLSLSGDKLGLHISAFCRYPYDRDDLIQISAEAHPVLSSNLA